MVTILIITITEVIIIIEIMDLLTTNMEEVEILIIIMEIVEEILIITMEIVEKILIIIMEIVEEILIIMAEEEEILITMVVEEDEIKENVTNVTKLDIWLEIVLAQMETKIFGDKVLDGYVENTDEYNGITGSATDVLAQQDR